MLRRKPQSADPLACKVAVVGFEGVGKSALILAWTNGNSEEEPELPVGRIAQPQLVTVRLPADSIPPEAPTWNLGQRIVGVAKKLNLNALLTASPFAKDSSRSRRTRDEIVVPTATPTVGAQADSSPCPNPNQNDEGHDDIMVNVEMEIWDTDSDCIRRICYPSADVVLLCVRVDHKASLDASVDWFQDEIRQFCRPGTPIIVVLCQIDLRDNPNPRSLGAKDSMRNAMITSEEGDAAAQQLFARHYFETSVKLTRGIEEVFRCAAKEGARYRRSVATRR
ncbi:GTP-binding protein [Coprinopsis cinerea AmutBmut pab1-1]|nr:GTP-binding protein [Coprinopsis cinerea AmutBmut pab1-1]